MRCDVIFDLDGTLVDSVVVCAEIINAMLRDRRAGFEVSQAETRKHISVGGPRMMAALMREHCGDSQQAIGEFRIRYAETQTAASSLFPHVREGLEDLAGQGFRLSICSSKPQNLCEKVLEELNLADWFQVVVGSQPGRPAKPDPALYESVLAQTGGTAQRSCYVGDSELDYTLAVRASVPFILATYGYAEAGFRPGRALLAHTFGEVPALVGQVLSTGARDHQATAVA